MVMRILILLFILLAFVNGCKSETYKDTYMAAVEKYLSELDSADSEIAPPPEPSYLSCPDGREPLPGFNGSGSSFGTMTQSQAVSPRRLPVRSFAQCQSINSRRKQAYEAALDRYHEILAAEAEKDITGLKSNN